MESSTWDPLYDRFKNAGRENASLSQFEDGVLHVKRRLLGFCRSSAYKTADEIASVLLDTGVASSIGDARNVIPALPGSASLTGLFYSGRSCDTILLFDPDRSRDGVYRVMVKREPCSDR